MFDMGPYYLTAFVTLFGPIRRVTGSARDLVSGADDHEREEARQENHRRDADEHRGRA